QMLAFTAIPARRWEPKRLRLRLLSIAGRVVRHARRVRLRLAATALGVDVLVAGLNRLTALPAPA
ncbi:transposase, partial [Rhodococcus rhodochrous]